MSWPGGKVLLSRELSSFLSSGKTILQKTNASSRVRIELISRQVSTNRSPRYHRTCCILPPRNDPCARRNQHYQLYPLQPLPRIRSFSTRHATQDQNQQHQQPRKPQQGTKQQGRQQPRQHYSDLRSLHEKLRQILDRERGVPVGRMNEEMIYFCEQTISQIAKGEITSAMVHMPPTMTMDQQQQQTNGNDTNRAVELADRLLDRLVEEATHYSRSTGVAHGPTVKIRPSLYSRVIRAWGRVDDGGGNKQQGRGGGETTDAAAHPLIRAQNVFERMKTRHEAASSQQADRDSPHPPPDVYTYSAMLYACAQHSTHPRAVSIAEGLVRELERTDDENNSNEHGREEKGTAASITRRSSGINGDVGEGPTPSSSLLATTSLYNNLIDIHANRADTQYNAANQAEDWLMHMSRRSVEAGPSGSACQPDTRSFNLVLKAWCMCPEENGADRALHILQLMMKLQKDDDHDTAAAVVQPDEVSFGTVISAFARRKRPADAEQCFAECLRYFLRQADQKVSLKKCLDMTIGAWRTSDMPEAPERAEGLLRDAYAFVKDGPRSVDLKPDEFTHFRVIGTFVRRGDRPSLEKAEQLLLEMVGSVADRSSPIPAPTTLVFNLVIDGWVWSGLPGCAARAARLLRTMLDLSERRGVACAPDIRVFHVCIKQCCQDRTAESISEALGLLNLAEVRSFIHQSIYVKMIETLSYSDTMEHAFLAADILNRFEMMIVERKWKWEPRYCGLYTAVIKGLAKQGGKSSRAADLALGILKSMPKDDETRSPTSRAYAGVIYAYSNVQNDRAARVALEIFEEIRRLSTDPNSKVDFGTTKVFAATLTALAGAGGTDDAAEQACNVLNYMFELYRSTRPDLEPDSKCLDACLWTLVNSGNVRHIHKALELSRLFIRNYQEGKLSSPPSMAGVRAVIDRCKRTGSADLVEEAKKLERVSHGVHPHHHQRSQ